MAVKKMWIEAVARALAEKWLQKKARNRSIDDLYLATLTKVMTDGGWRENGVPIIFGPGGLLYDGQHRLMAIVKSGVTIKLACVEDDDAAGLMEFVDEGKKRNLHQVLTMLGHPHARQLSTMISSVWRHNGGVKNQSSYRMCPTRSEALKILGANPHYKEIAEIMARLGLVPDSFIAVVMAGAWGSSPSPVDFFTAVSNGVGLEANDPAYLLRERFIAERSAVRKSERHYLLAVTIKAWNAWFLGEPISALRIRLSGKVAEKFPTVLRSEPT